MCSCVSNLLIVSLIGTKITRAELATALMTGGADSSAGQNLPHSAATLASSSQGTLQQTSIVPGKFTRAHSQPDVTRGAKASGPGTGSALTPRSGRAAMPVYPDKSFHPTLTRGGKKSTKKDVLTPSSASSGSSYVPAGPTKSGWTISTLQVDAKPGGNKNQPGQTPRREKEDLPHSSKSEKNEQDGGHKPHGSSLAGGGKNSKAGTPTKTDDRESIAFSDDMSSLPTLRSQGRALTVAEIQDALARRGNGPPGKEYSESLPSSNDLTSSAKVTGEYNTPPYSEMSALGGAVLNGDDSARGGQGYEKKDHPSKPPPETKLWNLIEEQKSDKVATAGKKPLVPLLALKIRNIDGKQRERQGGTATSARQPDTAADNRYRLDISEKPGRPAEKRLGQTAASKKASADGLLLSASSTSGQKEVIPRHPLASPLSNPKEEPESARTPRSIGRKGISISEPILQTSVRLPTSEASGSLHGGQSEKDTQRSSVMRSPVGGGEYYNKVFFGDPSMPENEKTGKRKYNAPIEDAEKNLASNNGGKSFFVTSKVPNERKENELKASRINAVKAKNARENQGLGSYAVTTPRVDSKSPLNTVKTSRTIKVMPGPGSPRLNTNEVIVKLLIEPGEGSIDPKSGDGGTTSTDELDQNGKTIKVGEKVMTASSSSLTWSSSFSENKEFSSPSSPGQSYIREKADIQRSPPKIPYDRGMADNQQKSPSSKTLVKDAPKLRTSTVSALFGWNLSDKTAVPTEVAASAVNPQTKSQQHPPTSRKAKKTKSPQSVPVQTKDPKSMPVSSSNPLSGSSSAGKKTVPDGEYYNIFNVEDPNGEDPAELTEVLHRIKKMAENVNDYAMRITEIGVTAAHAATLVQVLASLGDLASRCLDQVDEIDGEDSAIDKMIDMTLDRMQEYLEIEL